MAFATLLAEQIETDHPGITVRVVPTEGTVETFPACAPVTLRWAWRWPTSPNETTRPGPLHRRPKQRPESTRLPTSRCARFRRRERIFDLHGARVFIGRAGSGGGSPHKCCSKPPPWRSGRHAEVPPRRRIDPARKRHLGRVVWSGGVPTPAISDLDARLPLRMIDIGRLVQPMSGLASYPYVVHRVPTGEYVPAGIHSIGVPDLLLCRPDAPEHLVAAIVGVLAAAAPNLVPPYVRGLQYLDPPSMIQPDSYPCTPAPSVPIRSCTADLSGL